MLVSREHLGYLECFQKSVARDDRETCFVREFCQVDPDLRRGRNMSMIGEEKTSTITLSGKCEA